MASKTSRKTKHKETNEMNSEKIKLQGQLDKLYEISVTARKAGTRPRHKNLLESTKCHEGIHHGNSKHLINPKHISKLLKLRDLLSDDKLAS